jgi:phosphoglycolate phosphatase-like HAD superfamily hydrolase
MSERWIFLDLDGTLLDVSERYYRAHRDVVLRHGGWPFPRDVYWTAKRNLVPENQILIRCGLSAEAAWQAEGRRRQDLERPAYLKLDQLWPWMGDALTGLEERGKLAIVTLRNHRDRLEEQIQRIGLGLFCDPVISGRGDGTPEAKAALIRQSGISWAPGSVLVGDTEVDVASGKALGLRTVAVGNGIRSPALLERCSPDVLLADLRQVPAWLDGVFI